MNEHAQDPAGDRVLGLPSLLRGIAKRHPRMYDVVQRLRRRGQWSRTDPEWFLQALENQTSERVRFVQIGASDGLRNDPLRYFVVWCGWTGLLVEPLPTVFRQLVSNYAYLGRDDLTFVNAAVSSRSGVLDFYTIGASAKARLTTEQWFDLSRKSSLDRDAMIEALQRAGCGEEFLQHIRVPALRFHELAAQCPELDKVDVLVIDAEGHDAEILEDLDFETFRPSLVLFEWHRLGRATGHVLGLLRDRGYRTHQVGGDVVAENFLTR